MKIKIDIKNRFTGKVIFEFETENNTIKDTVLEAVKSGANLSGANLYGANLYGANLYSANLYTANLSGANLYGADLSRANLSRADLSGADLSGANLSGANLSGADLSRANLSRADLYSANLYIANLYRADLSGADLSRANLSRANLSRANLSGADLSRANLYTANLSGANLSGADLDISTMEKPWLLQTIPEGDIIGWKKVKGIIVKLLIPKEAKRCHGIGSRKNRAEFAMVLDVENKSKEILNTEYAELLYKAGQVSTPDSYDGDIKVECSHGINFFFSREEALAY